MEQCGLLSGIRVIDCGTYVAGPAAATVMSDFGADVIKIERPGSGDLWRLFSKLPGVARCDLDWCWVLTNRNKKSMVLDLAHPDGHEALIRLVRTADVFVTNYQQALLDKFQLRWEDLAAVNPRLIYAHLTGYGDAGDDADEPAYDALAYWARSGLMTSVTGTDGSPAAPRPAIGDHPTAISLFGAIMLGLYQRERIGKGARVTTSLLASGVWANGCDIQAKLLKAAFPQRGANQHPPNPLISAYLSRDQKIFLLISIDPDVDFPRICRIIGEPGLAQNELFATNQAREENAAALYEILRSQFESRDLADWAALFRRDDIKWAPLPLLEDVVKDPQIRAAQALVEFEHPGAGLIETVNSPIFVDGAAKRQPAPAPEVGQHTREILDQLGYNEKEIAQLMGLGGES